MKNILFTLIAIFGFAGVAFALPYFSSTQTMIPFVDNSYDVGSTTARYRNLYVQTASSTNLIVSGLNASNCDVKASANGTFSCGTDSTGSATFPFTPADSYNATSTAIGFLGGMFSVGSTTLPSLGTGLVKVTNGLLGTDTNTYATFGYPFPLQLGGGNATSSLVGFSQGFLSTASSTVNNNLVVTGTITASSTYGFSGVGENLTLSRIGASTYSTVQHLQDIFHSAGWVSGGTMTDIGGGAISVAAGTGLIRTSNSAVATVSYFDWTASTTLTAFANSITYIGIEYNGGSPRVVRKATQDWNYKTDFPIGRVVRENGSLYINSDVQGVGDHAANMIHREHETMPFARDELNGGLILSESGDGNRRVAVTAGAIWDRLNRYALTASSTAYFDTYSGATQQATEVSAWPNTAFSDGAGGLTTMTASKYANLWFYETTSGKFIMVYGTAEYSTLAAADNETEPATLPNRIISAGKLLGRIQFQKSNTTASEVDSAFSTSFASAAATNHANLSNLAWTASAHTGTANTVPYFTVSGSAGEFSTSTLNIGGNAATVTNGVYTTTFGNLFDIRLTATTSLPQLATLNGLTKINTYSGLLAGNSGNLFSVSTTSMDASITGLAGTATALASDPTDCGANTWANAIATSGNLTCSAITYAGITAMTSSNFAGLISDETGTGLVVLNNSPSFFTPALGYASSTQFTATSSAYFATSGGVVGIGTTTPYAKLSIGGDVVVGAATAGGTLGDLYLPNVASQSCIGTDAAGKVQAGTCTGGGGAFSWTPTTAMGRAVNATTTELWFQSGFIASSTNPVAIHNTTDAASNNVLNLYANSRVTPAANDQGYISLYGKNNATQLEYGRIAWEMDNVNPGDETSTIRFYTRSISLLDAMDLIGGSLNVNSGITAGSNLVATLGYGTVDDYLEIDGDIPLSKTSIALSGSTNSQTYLSIDNDGNVMTANYSAASELINGAWTEAGSGTHPLIAGLAIKRQTITAGAGAVSDTASLYIEGAAATTVVSGKNYSLWVDDVGGGGISSLLGRTTFGTSTVSSLTTLTVAATSTDTTKLLSLLDDTSSEVFSVSDTGNVTSLGSIDFGGATSFELPNGTSPTVDTDGECAIDTTSGQLVCDLGTSVKVIGNGNFYPAFTYATTSWTGTTTIPLGTAYVAETWNGIQCFTDAGTLQVSLTDGTNRMNWMQASTTAGTVSLTTNNTFTAAEKRYVEVGTPATSPRSISCTVSKSITAD